MEVMQQAPVKYPKVYISTKVIQIPSLLASGSKVTLLEQLYFEKCLLPKLNLQMGEKADAHSFLKITIGNDWQLSVRCKLNWT